jgi:hypothetical protein
LCLRAFIYIHLSKPEAWSGLTASAVEFLEAQPSFVYAKLHVCSKLLLFSGKECRTANDSTYYNVQDMVAFATDKAAASAWVSGKVGQYIFEGGVKIRWVAVGNEALADWYNVSKAIRVASRQKPLKAVSY